MLRALFIRRAFLLLDLLLVALVAYLIFQALMTYFSPGTGPAVSTVGDADAQEIQLARLDTRDAYRIVSDSGLFGDAARSRQDEEPPPPPEPPPPADDEVSSLPLRLWGTVSLDDPESPVATAVIERTGGGAQGRRVYFVGEVISDNVTLAEVHYKRVRIFNPTLNRHEWLVREEAQARPQPAIRRSATPPPARQVTGPAVSVESQRLVERIQTEGAQAYAQMAPSLRVAVDEDGEPLGITADGIGDVPLAQELGFQEGDILRDINGRPVQNPGELMSLVTQFQGVDTFRVGVLRNGSPQMLTISLR